MSRAIARCLRSNPTDAERVLWRHLRRRQLQGHRFRRQQPLGRYIVDFVCLEKRLIVEVDGGQHSEPKQAGYDAVRTAWLEAEEFRVMRFWDHEVLQQIEAVKEALLTALVSEQILPLLNPPPRGGRKIAEKRIHRRDPLSRVENE